MFILMTLLLGGLAAFSQVPAQPAAAAGPLTAHCWCTAGPNKEINLGQIAQYGPPLPQRPANQQDCRSRCEAAMRGNAQFNSDAYWCGILGPGTHMVTANSWVGTAGVIPALSRPVNCSSGGGGLNETPVLTQLPDDPQAAQAQASQILSRLCRRPVKGVSSHSMCQADAFGGGPDANPPMSASLTTYSTGKSRTSCDVNPTNGFVMGSIAIPSCKVCGGVLIVKARRTSVGSAETDNGNDSFAFGDATSNWAQNRLMARIWSTHFPNALQVTFAVPVPAALLNTLIFQRSDLLADFMAQDDTAIDYVQLLVAQ